MVSHRQARVKQLLKCIRNTQRIDLARLTAAIRHWMPQCLDQRVAA